MTIQEAFKYSQEQLNRIYELSEATAISDWLIEHLTGIKKSTRSIQSSKSLSPEQEKDLYFKLERLLTHEPLQYVLQESWFCGLKFYVDKNVLIPRPETEELVEWIISDCKFPLQPMKIFDIGTGSGCIAISLKRRLGKTEVWACDLSKPALVVAAKNASDIGVEISFLQLDFLNEQSQEHLPVFDIIVSNPPYIPASDKQDMQANVVEFEPASALFVPDNDALIFYRAIAKAGKGLLASGGLIYAEIHENLGADLMELFKSSGYQVELKKDMQGKDRMLKAWR